MGNTVHDPVTQGAENFQAFKVYKITFELETNISLFENFKLAFRQKLCDFRNSVETDLYIQDLS